MSEHRLLWAIFIAICAFVLALTLFGLCSAPSSYGDPNDDIETWTTSESQSPWTEMESSIPESQRSSKITVWHTTTSRSGSSKMRTTSTAYCSTGKRTITGRNSFNWMVVRFGMSIRWCFRPYGDQSIIWRKTIVNTWGETASWALWSYEGVSSMVKGKGNRCDDVYYSGPCWDYLYRRASGEFKRGLGDFAQHEYPWVSMTVRGNGQMVGDKMEA